MTEEQRLFDISIKEDKPLERSQKGKEDQSLYLKKIKSTEKIDTLVRRKITNYLTQNKKYFDQYKCDSI